MFVDLNTSATDAISADVLVVGAGACGLAMARSLARDGATVAILETGGFVRTPSAESLTDADVHGSLPVWIRSRSRFLGGSTNCWGGNNSPLDPVDFDRTWLPEAQWPIGLDDLAPYAETVHDLFHLGPVDFSTEFWKDRSPEIRDRVLFEGSKRVGTKLIQKTAVGHLGQSLERELDSSNAITVYLNAQVVNLSTNSTGSRIEGVSTVSLDRTRSTTARAKTVVLASGPENPRLLLASRDTNPTGVGNDYDQVGRWWLSHLSALRGWIEPTEGFDWSLYDLTDRPVGDVRVFGALQVSEEVQRSEKLLNGGAILEPFRPHAGFNNRARIVSAVKGQLGRPSESLEPQQLTPRTLSAAATDAVRVGVRSADKIQRQRKGRPARVFVRNWCEQMPDPDNRVSLSDRLDEFGVPRLAVQSNLHSEDRRTLRRSFDIIGEESERFGYGKWVSDFPRGNTWPAGAINTAHFMGGTRMHEDPESGVVDANCKVHGVDNLYVAGASVFPTAGISMVTYTAVLLALRTAAHLSGPQLRPAPEVPNLNRVTEHQGTPVVNAR